MTGRQKKGIKKKKKKRNNKKKKIFIKKKLVPARTNNKFPFWSITLHTFYVSFCQIVIRQQF